MTFGERIAQCFDIINEDYLYLITPEAYGIYHQLLWFKHDVFHGDAITYTYLSQQTGLSIDDIKKNISLLANLKLVKPMKRKEAVQVVAPPASLSHEEKLKLIEEFVEKGIIDKADHKQRIDNILAKLERKNQKRIEDLQPKDMNFGEIEAGNPDSPKNLVRYYYRKLREHFGGNYVSHNDIREASNLSNLMKKWGDSPENTRKFFDLIISKAKEKGKFNEVSSMSLYGNLRHKAHHALYGEAVTDSSFSKPIDNKESEMMQNMNGLHQFYMSTENMSYEQSLQELEKAFGKKRLNQFLEGINEKQVSVHQGTM